MLRSLIILTTCFLFNAASAGKIHVKTMEELKKANATAQPGDTIVLADGEWNNALVRLTCSGIKEKPIVFTAATPGKVVITGMSNLKLGGNYIVVDGWSFKNGYSPAGPVIDYHINDKQLANNCRVTNCVINNFNKPKRLDEDNWIAFYGKHNRLDHCSFIDKKNLGVLLAVILDDDRSRENFHSIDNNYFGRRPPLASNGGEIIRVGVSQHCQYNSNTQIYHNLFEECDGETEVISIKSGSNTISNNVLKQCQGSVVLRHGDNNTVINNLFLGNGKEATGGVRVINRGQWVINNLFYKCRGESFKAPLAVMNGIINSPANRYVQVRDVVIMNNSFVDCTPLSFGEGNDAERTLAPANVLFAKNIMYTSKAGFAFYAYDSLDGIRFIENTISPSYIQKLRAGIERTTMKTLVMGPVLIPVVNGGSIRELDSLSGINKDRLPALYDKNGFYGLALLTDLITLSSFKGASWFKPVVESAPVTMADCKTAADVYKVLSQHGDKRIRLTAANYNFTMAVVINNKIEFVSGKKGTISFNSENNPDALFIINGKGSLRLSNMEVDAKGCATRSFIMSDTSGMSEHFNLKIQDCSFTNLQACSYFFKASKSIIADSVIIRNSKFTGLQNAVSMVEETDDKGYYNAENIIISNNSFINGNGVLLDLYRGGNDESTLGPDLEFTGNKVVNWNYKNNPVMRFVGVQKTYLRNNVIKNSNKDGVFLKYADIVRARHQLLQNVFERTGSIEKDQFVVDKDNQSR